MAEETPVSSTWDAMRQRKLVQWALAYLAGAWVLLQALGLAAESYEWPHMIMRLAFGVLALGFVATLVLAWYHGERGEQEIRGTELLILALLLAVGGGLLWYTERSGRAHMQSATQDSTGDVAASAAIPAKSIAVLPFENLSGDKDNIYFVGGMQDEILTRLAGIRDLKVISRSSTAKYVSHPDDLRTVGKQLGVATVLEGSVQKAGDAVHINVRLVDARDDNQLWAESYDRDLKDIFGVERDVAQKVADALKARLMPAESALIAKIPTRDTQAYDLYLRAGYHFHRADDQNVLMVVEMPQAIALYEQALDSDPNFALAAAMQARSHMNMYWFGRDRTPARLDAAKAAAERSLALQPDLGEGHLALGLYHYWGHRDYTQAAHEWALASRTMPNSADIERYLAAMATRQGRSDDAIAHGQKAIALAPRSADPYNQLGSMYTGHHQYARAEQFYLRAAAVTQDPGEERMWIALNRLDWKGDLDTMRAALAAMAPGSDLAIGNANYSYKLAWLSRDYAAAAKVAESDKRPTWSTQTNNILPRELFAAWAYEAMGDRAKSAAVYASVRDQVQDALKTSPEDHNLHLALGFAQAGLGDRQSAIHEAEQNAALLPVTKDAVSGVGNLVLLAQLYVRVGDADAALKLLDQALAMPSGQTISPALLKLDPVWDRLRKDPRFGALLTKYASIGRD
jgi:TolB-like protein/Tfp pilus assembly protein PilF